MKNGGDAEQNNTAARLKNVRPMPKCFAPCRKIVCFIGDSFFVFTMFFLSVHPRCEVNTTVARILIECSVWVSRCSLEDRTLGHLEYCKDVLYPDCFCFLIKILTNVWMKDTICCAKMRNDDIQNDQKSVPSPFLRLHQEGNS